MVATPDEDVGGLIRMHVLGASEIQIGRKKVTLSTEVVFALGFYLCARAGERLTREDVTEIFWGEGREAQSRHSLRQMLYRLRQKGLTLDEESEELYLDPARVDSDLARALADDWPVAADAAAIEAAGAFAPGFTRFISERFQAWLDGVKDRLAAQHRRGALQQIAFARREGRWADLERWALQVMRSDPLNEEATLARAESAAMAGSKSVALEIIDAYMEELGDRAAVIGLPATILRRRIAERRTEWTGTAAREVRLVGRRELMSSLTGFVDSVSTSRPTGVLLWGAPGIGKTRLAEEARAYAELMGHLTVSARATVAHAMRPLSLLLALIPAMRELPGAAGCEPSTLALFDRFFLRKESQRPDLEPLVGAISTKELLLTAFRDLLDAISSETRLFVLLDDLHNSDEASRLLIFDAIASTHSQRIKWVATSRTRVPVDAASQPVFAPLHVPPLKLDESHELAESFARIRSKKVQGHDVSRVALAAGGNPLFVRELSAHGSGARPGTSLPKSLTDMIAERLQQLDGPALRLLRLTTLLGSQATVSRVRALTQLPTPAFADLVESLESDGVISLGLQQTLDLHECWQQVVNEEMNALTRAALSLESAQALASPFEKPDSVSLAWRAATLFADAGEFAAAVKLFTWVGEEMLAGGLPAESADILSRALAYSRTPQEQHRVLAVLARSQYASGEPARVVETSNIAFALPRGHSGEEFFEHAILLALRTESLMKLHQDHRADLAALATLAQHEALSAEVRHFVCLTGLVTVFADGSSPIAPVFFESSKRATDTFGPTTLGCLVQLIYYAESGAVDDVRAINRVLEGLEIEDIPAALRCRSLRYRAAALRFAGDMAAVTRLGNRAFEESMRCGLTNEAWLSAELMIFACLDSEDIEGATTWLRRWDGMRVKPAYAQRAQAVMHATARIHAQSGKYELALAVYGSGDDLSASDTLRSRRAVDLATLALSFAGVGKHAESRALLPSIEEIVGASSASFQMDYVVEMHLRTLDILGDIREKSAVCEDYHRQRAKVFQAPLRPFCRELSLLASRRS